VRPNAAAVAFRLKLEFVVEEEEPPPTPTPTPLKSVCGGGTALLFIKSRLAICVQLWLLFIL